MRTHTVVCWLAATSLSWALMAGAPASAARAPFDAAWNANGATACEKFLTPEVMSAVLDDPSGAATKDGATSCHRGSIYIVLKVSTPSLLKQEIPRIAFAHAMTGVGDVAFWNPAGAVSAAKAPDRGCDISVLNAPAVAKLKDEPLGQKLGAVCNQLFALK
jgi:hypothetical protein